MRKPRGLIHVRLYAHQQLERLEGAYGFFLVRADIRDIAAMLEHPANLSDARLQDFIGENPGHHFAAGRAHHRVECSISSYSTLIPMLPPARRGNDLSLAWPFGAEHGRIPEHLAFPEISTADDIQALD